MCCSGLADYRDSKAYRKVINSLGLSGWTYTDTLRQALMDLKDPEVRPPQSVFDLSERLLNTVETIDPDTVVLLDDFEWSPPWGPYSKRKIGDIAVEQ